MRVLPGAFAIVLLTCLQHRRHRGMMDGVEAAGASLTKKEQNELGYFDRLRFAEGTISKGRKGCVDVIEHTSPVDGTKSEVALLHILGLLGFSRSVRKGCQPVHARKIFLELAAALMAVEHFNNGNGVVVDDVEGIHQRCNVRLTTEFHDTEYDPASAVKTLTRIFSGSCDVHGEESIKGEANISTIVPGAVLGARLSSVSKPAAIVAGVYGAVQMSYTSSSPELNDKFKYPLFSRIIPSDDSAAKAAVMYLTRYNKAEHCAVIFINDSWGNEYQKAVQREGSLATPRLETRSFPIKFDATEDEVRRVIWEVKETGYRNIFALIFKHLFEPVMTEAMRQGIAGPGYAWLHGNNGVMDFVRAVSYEKGSSLAIATDGMAILPEAGGRPNTQGYERFLQAWESLGDTHLPYLNSKLPRIGREDAPCFLADEGFFDTKSTRTEPPFAYDTVITLGLAACNATYDNTYFDGKKLAQSVVERTRFHGATGLITIDPTTISRTAETFSYEILNAISRDKNGTKNVTFSTPESIIMKPNKDGSDWILVETNPFIFADGSNVAPAGLPVLVYNWNHIGNLTIMGYILCSICILLSVVFGTWSYVYRNVRIVRASQPLFLMMICVGTFILGSAIIPLSVDDQYHSQHGCNVACMATPWLVSIGFVTAFSALFSKTWRINKIFRNPNRFRRIKVKEKDVIVPFVVLMTTNVGVLTFWTILHPLKYVRIDGHSTDEWNRVKSSVGICTSEGSRAYMIVLAFINMAVVILANVQAYQARNIHTEYSESRYIAMTMASLLQAWFIGIPLLILVRETPRADFVVRILILFVSCMAILLLIFVPKMIFMEEWKKCQQTRKDASTQTSEVPKESSSRDRKSSSSGSRWSGSIWSGSNWSGSRFSRSSGSRRSGNDNTNDGRLSLQQSTATGESGGSSGVVDSNAKVNVDVGALPPHIIRKPEGNIRRDISSGSQGLHMEVCSSLVYSSEDDLLSPSANIKRPPSKIERNISTGSQGLRLNVGSSIRNNPTARKRIGSMGLHVELGDSAVSGIEVDLAGDAEINEGLGTSSCSNSALKSCDRPVDPSSTVIDKLAEVKVSSAGRTHVSFAPSGDSSRDNSGEVDDGTDGLVFEELRLDKKFKLSRAA